MVIPDLGQYAPNLAPHDPLDLLQAPPANWFPFTYTPLDWESPPFDPDTTAFEDFVLCGPDPRWFLELCVEIPTQKGSIPFQLWPWMHQALDPYATGPSGGGVTSREIMLKSREIGSSTLWVAEKLRKVITNPGANLLIAADKEDNAKNLMAYLQHMFLSIPERYRPAVERMNMTEMYFNKAWYIKALPGGNNVGRSDRARYLIATEMAFWGADSRYDPEQYWTSVTGTLAEEVGRDEMVIESTANGTENRFHDMYYDRTNGYRKHFFPWMANPRHTFDWYRKRRQDFMRKERKAIFLFVQEYPTTAEEAFQGSTDMYFDRAALTVGQAAVLPPIEIEQVGKADSDPGELHIWKFPVPGSYYVMGVDVAEGKDIKAGDNPDWCHAYVMDWRSEEVVASLHCRLHEDDYAHLLSRIGRWYNNAFVGIERNGPGLAVIAVMKLLGYKNLYVEYSEKQVRGLKHQKSEPGWVTSGKSKPIMLNQLNMEMKARSFRCPDDLFWDQAKGINRVSMKANGSGKDDAVMALAITLQMRLAFRTENQLRMGAEGHKAQQQRSKPTHATAMPWSSQGVSRR